MRQATDDDAKVHSPVEVKRRGIEITIEGLTNELKWTTFRHPDEATIPLSVLRARSEFHQYIPTHLDILVEDYGGVKNDFELLLCELVDYKMIPLCSPPVSRIIVAGDVKSTVSNPEGVKLWETLKVVSETAQEKGTHRGVFDGLMPEGAGSIEIYVLVKH